MIKTIFCSVYTVELVYKNLNKGNTVNVHENIRYSANPWHHLKTSQPSVSAGSEFSSLSNHVDTED